MRHLCVDVAVAAALANGAAMVTPSSVEDPPAAASAVVDLDGSDLGGAADITPALGDPISIGGGGPTIEIPPEPSESLDSAMPPETGAPADAGDITCPLVIPTCDASVPEPAPVVLALGASLLSLLARRR